MDKKFIVARLVSLWTFGIALSIILKIRTVIGPDKAQSFGIAASGHRFLQVIHFGIEPVLLVCAGFYLWQFRRPAVNLFLIYSSLVIGTMVWLTYVEPDAQAMQFRSTGIAVLGLIFAVTLHALRYWFVRYVTYQQWDTTPKELYPIL